MSQEGVDREELLEELDLLREEIERLKKLCADIPDSIIVDMCMPEDAWEQGRVWCEKIEAAGRGEGKPND